MLCGRCIQAVERAEVASGGMESWTVLSDGRLWSAISIPYGHRNYIAYVKRERFQKGNKLLSFWSEKICSTDAMEVGIVDLKRHNIIRKLSKSRSYTDKLPCF